MGKQEQDARIVDFKNAMNNRDYDEAVQIADTLDIKHIRDNNLLSLIADAYELSKDYELAKQVLLFAYENTKAGRHLAYRLCLVSIKNGEIDEAREYYEDFVEMAPKDTGRYVLQYKMAEATNEPKEKLIAILEEYVNIDMEEKWAYELAKLYKETGDTSKCVELCDEMGLWFSEGRYIKKAMELKKSIQPLNITQQQLLDKEEPIEEIVNTKKSEPHVSKSPIASIMEKQPERTPYVDPDEDKSENAPYVEPASEQRLVSEKVSDTLKPFTFNEEPDDYKPSFDITEIKVVNETQKQPEDILTAKPVDDGPQQMSFFDQPKEDTSNGLEPGLNEKTNGLAPGLNETPSSFTPSQEPAPAQELQPGLNEEPLPDVQDVEDMLKKLQERGILGADTVNKAVNIIDNDVTHIEEELKEEVDSIMSAEEDVDSTNEIKLPEEEPVAPIMDELVTDKEEPAESVMDEVVTEETPDEELETKAEDYERPQNRYSREEPEEINPIVPEMANNFSDDDDVAEAIISGKDFTQPDVPVVDDVEDSKFHTVQVGTKWESDDDRVIDQNSIVMDEDQDEPEEVDNKEPVEAGVMDDFEPSEDPLLDVGNTKDIGDVMHQPTEIMPGSDELEKEKKKDYQAAKVLDEAVPPTSEEQKDVPVFDLSGEYTSQDNGDSQDEPDEESIETPSDEPASEIEKTNEIEMAEGLEPEPVIKKVLKESNETSAKIDMISGDAPENKPEPKPEPTESKPEEETKEEPKEQSEQVEATKQVELPEEKEKKSKVRKEKKKELNTERVNFNVTDADMAVFGNYLNVEGLESSVKKVCNDLVQKFTGQNKETNANVIVMGDEKTGKTTMAIEIIKLVNKKSERRNRKVAKISAETLNKKSFTKVLAKIQGCDLIVENAQDIHITTIQEMVSALSPNNTDSIIILEAETEPMEKLLESTFSLGQTFKHIVKIKQYNIREWVAYGSNYAKTQGYKLDEVAELALFKSIDDAFGAHKGISKLDVEEIIDKAISRSERFGRKIFGGKKDEEGLKLLDESDFNINLK